MKSFVKWLPVILFLFLSCTEEKTILTPSLDTDTLEFSDDGEAKTFSITSGTDWEIILSDDWLSLDTTKGKGNATINLTAIRNDAVGSRQATIIVKSGLTELSLTVTQAGQVPYLTFFPLQIQKLTTGGEEIIKVNTNFPYEVVIPNQDTTWLSVKDKTDKQFVLVVDANIAEAIRESSISLQLIGTSIIKSIPLSQKGALKPNTINISVNEASFPVAGGELSVDLEANVAWDVYIPTDALWITLKSKGTNNVKLTIAQNNTASSRTSKVSFRNNDGSALAECAITQVSDGYVLTADMTGDDNNILDLTDWNSIDTYMKKFGYEYSEHPESCNTLGYAHLTMRHCTAEYDATLNKNVLRFDIHVTPFLDRDRCTIDTYDRQRNEMKTRTDNATWAKVQGNYDEWQILEWKFKLNAGLKPSSSFFHIHQLKAQDGTDNGSPLITITPRATNRIQIIHTARSGGRSLGTMVDNANLSEYLGEWVQVHEEMHYNIAGSYKILITRIRDNKVLMSYETSNIDLWRKGSSFIRNKYGLYRSFGGDVPIRTDGTGTPPNGIKNESMWVTDFKIYEKNTNPNPSAAHD